eukprot:2646896-Pleurochrysis_carterae.AAC.2
MLEPRAYMFRVQHGSFSAETLSKSPAFNRCDFHILPSRQPSFLVLSVLVASALPLLFALGRFSRVAQDTELQRRRCAAHCFLQPGHVNLAVIACACRYESG